MGRGDSEDDVELFEIYGEYIKPFDLAISFLVTIITGALSYLVAPILLSMLGAPATTQAPLSITIGLVGASLGFLLTLLFIKPKRIVEEG